MRKLKRRSCPVPDDPPQLRKPKMNKLISTGSTLLDLAVSGKVTDQGGIPGGIIIEVYGPSGAGKTAILASMAASVQSKGGAVKFLDPEARLNQEYCRIYGMNLKASDYHRPDLVEELFEHIYDWHPKNRRKKAINLVASDSIAALTTDWELEGQDQYGMRRAKQFSEGLRKTARIIANNNWIIVCSNQERQGPQGLVTGGGKSMPYYSSLRIRIAPQFPKGKIFKEKTVGKKKIKRVEGIISTCQVTKSTIDDPHREAPVFIMFGYGIDDIRGNLQYTKDMTGGTKYDCITKTYTRIDQAIAWIEDNELEEDLRLRTIEVWNDVQDKFKMRRKPKTII